MRAYANLANEMAEAGYSTEEAAEIKRRSATTKKCEKR